MEKENREYRTGQGVPLTGSYLCQSGVKATLNKHDEFPKCPVSGEETYWKRDVDE